MSCSASEPVPSAPCSTHLGVSPTTISGCAVSSSCHSVHACRSSGCSTAAASIWRSTQQERAQTKQYDCLRQQWSVAFKHKVSCSLQPASLGCTKARTHTQRERERGTRRGKKKGRPKDTPGPFPPQERASPASTGDPEWLISRASSTRLNCLQAPDQPQPSAAQGCCCRSCSGPLGQGCCCCEPCVPWCRWRC